MCTVEHNRGTIVQKKQKSLIKLLLLVLIVLALVLLIWNSISISITNSNSQSNQVQWHDCSKERLHIVSTVHEPVWLLALGALFKCICLCICGISQDSIQFDCLHWVLPLSVFVFVFVYLYFYISRLEQIRLLALGAIFPEADPAFLYQLDKSDHLIWFLNNSRERNSNTSLIHLKYLLFILTAKDVFAFASNGM